VVASAQGDLGPRTNARYALADPGVNLVGRIVARQLFWRLYKITPPLRLANETIGRDPDGWMGQQSAYAQFSTAKAEAIRIRIDRPPWAKRAQPVTITVREGPLADRKGRLTLRHIARTRTITIRSTRTRTITLPPAVAPFLVTANADRTFAPASVGRADPRRLSAVIQYSAEPVS
jgi:hypothetical protein